ncbi:MAG: hypothetical protein ACHQ6U_14055, partial [Thermodesulfobacteriota bacterium]
MSKRSGIAFGLLLVMCVGIMAAYIFEFQEGSDVQLVTDEDQAENATPSPTGGLQAEAASQKLENDIQKTKYLQDKRKRIMDEMVSDGIADRIENPTGEPFVYVMKPFYGLSFKEQSSLMNVIWSYYITE